MGFSNLDRHQKHKTPLSKSLYSNTRPCDENEKESSIIRTKKETLLTSHQRTEGDHSYECPAARVLSDIELLMLTANERACH